MALNANAGSARGQAGPKPNKTHPHSAFQVHIIPRYPLPFLFLLDSSCLDIMGRPIFHEQKGVPVHCDSHKEVIILAVDFGGCQDHRRAN